MDDAIIDYLKESKSREDSRGKILITGKKLHKCYQVSLPQPPSSESMNYYPPDY